MNTAFKPSTITMTRHLANTIGRRTYSVTAKVSGIAAWSPSMGYHKIVTAKPLDVCYIRPRRNSIAFLSSTFFKQLWKGKFLWSWKGNDTSQTTKSANCREL
jgi:hypothetical protein